MPFGPSYLQARIDAEIPLARHIRIVVEQADDHSLVLSAPLQPNVNHQGTAFGGSLYCVAVLTGWAWATRYLNMHGIGADAVIQESHVEFLAPVHGELRSHLIVPAAAEIDKFRRCWSVPAGVEFSCKWNCGRPMPVRHGSWRPDSKVDLRRYCTRGVVEVTGKLILVRHGQSVWNVENLFTGWHDVDLTDLGRVEAEQAGKELLREGLKPDIAFTSVLKRAIRTLWIILDTTDRMWLPVERTWRLNERHYGALQGLDKAQTVAKHGDAQVKIWRRSYDIPPPPLDKDDPRQPRFDPRYAEIDPTWLPSSESLKDTLARVLPYWESRVVPQLRDGKNVLIVAHGNSLRALVKMLDMMAESDIVEFNIPTGIPILYDLDDQLQPLGRRFLGDPKAIAAAQDAVKRQTEKKTS